MQSAAVRWGFQPSDVGLVTGNRRENPDARVLVVVAEILLNRLLHSGKGSPTRRAWLMARPLRRSSVPPDAPSTSARSAPW